MAEKITGHDENLGFGDLVAADLSHMPLLPEIIIGTVLFVNQKNSRVVISTGSGLATAWTEAVQWLMRARDTVFEGGAKATWQARRLVK